MDDGAITTGKIASGAVGMAQLAAGSVSSANSSTFNTRISFSSQDSSQPVPSSQINIQTSGGNLLLISGVELTETSSFSVASVMVQLELDGNVVANRWTSQVVSGGYYHSDVSFCSLVPNVAAGAHTVQLASFMEGPVPMQWKDNP